MKKALVVVEGGLGKHIIFTALARQLKEKYGEVNVVSPYPDVMKACESIDKSFQFGTTDLSKLVYEKDCDIFNGNPYTNQAFIKKKIHLLDAWSQQLGLKYSKSIPEIDTSLIDDKIQVETDKVIKDLGNKYIVVQLTGGQSPITEGQGQYVEVLKRNYPYAQKLVNLIHKKYPKYKIVNFALPNEPDWKNTVKLQIPYIFYFNILKKARRVVCIDSALQHMAAAVGQKATVIWGETKPNHFGWDLHDNLLSDEQIGSPYFVALGPSPANIEFPSSKEIAKRV